MAKEKNSIEDDIERNIERKLESWADGRGRCGDRRRHTFWRVLWGLFFLVAAGGIAAEMFDWLTFSINIWWLVLAIFLIAMMIASIAALNWFGFFVPVACIVTIMNYQTDWLGRSLSGQEIGGVFMIAVLLSIAFSILFHRRGGCKARDWVDSNGACFARKVASSDDDSEIVIVARLGEAVRYIESNKLEKVSIDCVMSNVKVYFNNAVLVGDELSIDVRGTMSGVEMYIPRHWRLVNDMNMTAGNVDEKNRAEWTADSPVVRLTGNASLSGVEIIYI